MLVSLGILLLTFGSGVASGLFLGGGTSSTSDDSEKTTGSSSSSFSSSAEAQERIEGNSLLSNRIRELEKDLAEQKKDQNSVLADRLAFFKKHDHELWFPAFQEGSLQITPAMAEFLGLSKQEQSAVEEHLREIQKEMEQLTDANTAVTKQTANGITYRIAADPKGKELKDQLTGYLSADIGDERAALFMDHGQFDSVSSPFSGFGQQKSEIDINWINQNGKPMYTYKESYGGGSSWSDTPEPNLPMQLQKYLPPDSPPAP